MPGVELGTLLGGTYRIVRRIGSGGMGEVYEATHERLAVRYAVKFVHPDALDHPEALPRFMREAQVTSQLRHPGIVAVIDFNTLPNGSAYLVMEYLEGEALGKILKRTGPMPLARVADLAEQMSSALSAAHAQGIVHRDMHPQNVFVLPPTDSEGERIKILDFGISKIASASQKITGSAAVMGTPLYMSPEQAEGRTSEIDAASDQFSLAAIVYEMLTGRPAFSGDTLASIAYQIVHATPAPASAHRPELPPELESVVSRALAKNKSDRFPSVAEFAVHLRWTASLAASPTSPQPLAAVGAPPRVASAAQEPTEEPTEEPTVVSMLPSGIAAVIRETSTGLSGRSGAPVAARGGRARPTTRLRDEIGEALGTETAVWLSLRRRSLLLAAVLLAGGLSIGAGLLVRSRAHERTNPRAAPARAVLPAPSEAPAPPTGETPAAGGAPAPPAEQAGAGAPVESVGPVRGRPRAIPARAAASEGAVEQEAAVPEVAEPKAGCLLTVGSYPWSELWVDGTDTGEHTPVVRQLLKCGAHKLELKRSDLGIDQVEDVILEEGREIKRHFDLRGPDIDN